MRVIFAVACAALMMVTAGCGGDGKGPTGTVEGKLTLAGNPAPKGTIVQFMSEKGASSGTCGADGAFTVMGLPVGTYRVAIAEGASEEVTNMDPIAAMKKSQEDPNAFDPSKSKAIPQKYRSPDTSGITFEVKEGSNDFVKDIKE